MNFSCTRLRQLKSLPAISSAERFLSRAESFAVRHPVYCHIDVPMFVPFVNHFAFLPLCFFPLPFGLPPFLPHSLNCSCEYFRARVFPPIEPVLRK
jgi:hypothetical protein